MAKYRASLPPLTGAFFLTDGGLETTLIFADGQDLPHFAAFPLFKTEQGANALCKYFETYANLANRLRVGLLLETATWRASADWGQKLGYNAGELIEANRASVRLLEEVRRRYETDATPIVISGCVGPRGDGYVPSASMSETQAREYHHGQIETFAGAAADLVSAITMNYEEEAVGIALAARDAKMPVVVSFTVETDGKLPTGQSLGVAIERVDVATECYPVYYMINCAHPSHFAHAIQGDEPWVARIRGLRANASRRSHTELNEAPELDAGNPTELGREYAELKSRQLKHLNVMGGCCGTDDRHIEKIATACLGLFGRAS